MNKNSIFQQEADIDLRQPWPVVVDAAHNIVIGRPDADFLVGFAPSDDIYSLSVLPEDIEEDLSKAVGLVPVFGKVGKFFTSVLKVSTIREYAGDIEALRRNGK